MLEFIESLGFIYVTIIITLIILCIFLIKAIFEMRDHLESLDTTIKKIAKNHYGIDTTKSEETEENQDSQITDFYDSIS